MAVFSKQNQEDLIELNDLKQSSFLVYGLGLTGKSVINFFKKNNIKNFKIWDDHNKKLYKSKRPINLQAWLNCIFFSLSPLLAAL